MAQDYPDINTASGGDDFKTGVVNLIDRSDTLRSCFSGTSSPSSPVEGQLWADTSATPYLLKWYADIGAGAAWVVIGPIQRLNSAISLDPSSGGTRATVNEAVIALEDRGAHISAAAGNVGYLYLLTGDGAIHYMSTASVRATILNILLSGSYDTVELDLNSFLLDATNPPTVKAKGSTPTLRGFEFDAANELAVLPIVVPANWDGASDLVLELDCVLDQAESNGDDIDWSADWIAATPGTSGDLVSKTSTAAAASATDIGSSNTGDGALHRCSITIDHDHADNPVVAGDLLAVEIHRTDLAQVGGVIVVAARLKYLRKARETRA